MKKLFSVSVLLLGSLLLAESFTYQEEVRVSSSQQEYRQTSSRAPYQECWDEQVEVQSSSSGSEGTVGAVIGGVAGGVLGHQVGRGTGNTVATIGGAVVGSVVGKNIGEQSGDRSPTYRTERRCATRYDDDRGGEQVRSYRNVAYYKNQQIVKYSDRPLEYIRINVTVSY